VTPLRLELSGFTCFKERVMVDFSDLTLFSISGPTGSGKSTLLDAMTYSLYGQIARLGSKGLELISPGMNQMFVQFEFQNHQGIYRVTRTLDRKKSRNDAQTRIEKLEADATWKQLSESEKIKEANTRLEQLVGLDYEGFTRAILLPQGAFDEFLRGDPSQRRQLLVSLLNLDKVQKMQQEAGQRAKQAEMQRDAIKTRLDEEYGGATPERKRELKDSLDSLSNEQVKTNKQFEALSKDVKELEALKSLFDEQAKVQKVLLELKAQEATIHKDKERLEQAKRAEFLLPQIKHVETLNSKVQSLEKNLITKRSEQTTLKASLEKLSAELQTLEKKHLERLPQIEEQLIKLSSFAPMLEQLRVRGGSLALASQATDLSYSEATWEAMQERLSQLPGLQQAEKLFIGLEQDCITTFKKQEELQKSVQGLDKQLELLTQKGLEAKAVYTEAKETYEQAVLRDQASVLREHLHQGDTCPVCEQIISSLPEKQTTNLNQLKQQRDDLEEVYKKLQAEYADVRANARAEKQRLTEQEQSFETMQQKRQEAKAQLDKLLNSFADFGNDANTISSHLQNQKQQLLIALAKTVYEQTGGVDVTSKQKTLQQEKRDLTETLKSAESNFRNAERNADKLQNEVSSLESQLEQSQQEQTQHFASITELLSKASFASLQAVKQAALSTQEIKILETQLSSFAAQKENAERRDVELQAKLSGRSFDVEAFHMLQEQLVQTQDNLDNLKDTIGRTKQQLSDIEVMLEKANQLRKESEAQSKLYDTYYQLAQDLRGNNFQDYLLNQMQSKLAIRASQMIKDVTEGRYDLRLIEGEYQVFDNWMQESRSVKTLSGGETFIASLALALALSDLLAGNKALGALFLDEGFGTLDADTLEVVADVLEGLSDQGRMVGVITHVQALSERLPARLMVRKSAEGSYVSWDL
jgi:DNA repair protein SbcC/Rad50